MIYASRWLLPIDHRPLEGGWIEIVDRRIVRLGQGQPPAPAEDLGDVAILPGLVNAHTHLELSWMAGLVPPAASMDDWISTLMRVRRAGASGGAQAEGRAAHEAAARMHATGTVLVGDISNALSSVGALAHAGLGGVVFHELLGFGTTDAAPCVSQAMARAAEAERAVADVRIPIRVTLAAHAPYSVSPALFREIAARVDDRPLTVHLGESPEEIEFLRTGRGPIRRMLDDLGVYDNAWTPPRVGPVDYLASVGYLRAGLLAAHGVHLTDDELDRLASVGATIVTCPRSNLWVGAGMPRLSHFYASGVQVAVGTDSLASTPTLSVFDELAEMRRIAPDVAAASLLESATRVGAEALGFGRSHGTIAPHKAAALIAVDVPSSVTDVEEYLVSGVPAESVRHLS